MGRSEDNLSGGSGDAARVRLTEALVGTGEEDRSAFQRVYALTSAKLFGICFRICGDRQAAEDVLHEVYLTIWKRAGSFQPGRASPITWLATVARNRAIDWRRANPARRTGPFEWADDIADGGIAADDAIIAGESDRRLHLCLDSLDANQRSAIRAAFFDGLTYAELAQRKEVPLGTMKSWVRRGLARLKDCLDDD
ncbi:sigma-70 family RNA polymerase sigma factor [Novosphingobium sp. PS1R-30]|uniref:Sigma-70 family RNA polymerase sigma factor n=1 Tax=Novosphingobium anseongense TaxID=3133436 RepID=A0ABU8S2M3_9SPHN